MLLPPSLTLDDAAAALAALHSEAAGSQGTPASTALVATLTLNCAWMR